MECIRVAVAGASGFIGQSVVRTLASVGFSVRAVARTRPADFHDHGSVDWHLGDLYDPEFSLSAFEGQNAVIHVVGGQTPAQSNIDILQDMRRGTELTVRLLDAARRNGVGRFIFTSSGGAVYGIPESAPVAEGALTKPISAYGVSKLSSERYLELFEYLFGMKCYSLRVSNPYGPGQYPLRDQGVISHFASRALQGHSLRIFGDGNSVRDFIYISDVADAFRAALEYQGHHRVFNVGSGYGLSVNQIIDIMDDKLGIAISREYEDMRKADVSINFLDVSRAYSELQWEPKVDLDSGLSRTIEWMQKLVKIGSTNAQ